VIDCPARDGPVTQWRALPLRRSEPSLERNVVRHRRAKQFKSLALSERAILAAGKVVWLDPQLTVDGRLRHGIRFVRFGSDSSLVGYRDYLTQIAPSQSS
jgi:hypothetical protein